jgi:hypothetical protein
MLQKWSLTLLRNEHGIAPLLELGGSLMESVTQWQKVLTEEAGAEFRTKRQIFEKVFQNPDVVVTLADHVLLFEPQNIQATEWLHQRCGLSMDNAQERDPVRVHPYEWRRIIDDLRNAGFKVLC